MDLGLFARGVNQLGFDTAAPQFNPRYQLDRGDFCCSPPIANWSIPSESSNQMVSIQLDGNGLPGNNDPDNQILDDSDLLAGVPIPPVRVAWLPG